MDRLRSNLLLAINCSWRPLILLLLRRCPACRPLGRPALLQERVDSAAHNLRQQGRRQHNHRSLLLLLLHRQADNGSGLLLLRGQHWQGYMGPLLANWPLHNGQRLSCQLHASVCNVACCTRILWRCSLAAEDSHSHPAAPVGVLPAT